MLDGKKEKIQKLNEAEFRETVLMPLLKLMGCKDVRLTHGAFEHGKDIVFSLPTVFGQTYYAVVAKVGNISGAKDGRDNLTNLLRTIKDQIETSFDMPVQDPTNKNSKTFSINYVIVWTSGVISLQAKEQIIEKLDTRYRNVEFRDLDATIDLLDEHYPSYFTIADATVATYFKQARQIYSRLEEIYSINGGDTKRHLKNVFVAPTLEKYVRTTKKQAEDPRTPEQKVTFSHLLKSKDNTLIIGDMGSGKSALLRRLLLETIERNEEHLRKFPLPILIRFKQLDLEKENVLNVQAEDCIEVALAEQFAQVCPTHDPIDIIADLNAGNLMVLIDGLDELQEEEAILSALTIVNRFAKRYPKTRIILSSRMLELFKTTKLLSRFKVYRILAFSSKQIKQLINNWFGKDSVEGKRLINLVTNPVAYTLIPSTPLALALVAVLYENGQQDLPANLTELFSKYTELALGRWDMGKEIKSQISWVYKKLALRKVSWDALLSGETGIQIDDLWNKIEQLRDERALSFSSDVLIDEILQRSDLLIQNEYGKFDFKHRGFLDYLAGEELNSRPDACEIIVEKFNDLNWFIAIFFACGINASEEYLKAILRDVVVADEDYLLYATHLGYIAQATYLATKEEKLRAVKNVLHTFVKSWNYYATASQQDEEVSSTSENYIPHLVLMWYFTIFIKMSLGSTTLATSLNNLTQFYVERSSDLTSMPEDGKAEWGWFGFCMAIACAGAECVDDFLSLYESNMFSDAQFAYMGYYECVLLLEKEGLTDEQLTRIQNLKKKLGRKLRANKEYIDQLFTKHALPIKVATNEEMLLLENGDSIHKLNSST
jgi:hypothetical protein